MSKIKMKKLKIQVGDIVRNKLTDRTSLVVKVEDNTLVLADVDYPQFGYKARITIIPLYEVVGHLNEKEFNDRLRRDV